MIYEINNYGFTGLVGTVILNVLKENSVPFSEAYLGCIF